MSGFFRTLRSVFSRNSHKASQQEIQTRHVRILSPRRSSWGTLGLSCALGYVAYSSLTAPRRVPGDIAVLDDGKDNKDEKLKPALVPIGWIEKVEPIPYRPGCKEWMEARRFLKNTEARQKAEGIVIKQILTVLANAKADSIGQPIGIIPNYWMWFGLPPPPPTYQRKYLEIRPTGMSIVTKPVDPAMVVHLSSILYPKAVMSAFWKFWSSMYKSSNDPRSFIREVEELPEKSEDGEEHWTEAFRDSETLEAVQIAISDSLTTLVREWAKSRQAPPPPRGSLIGEGIMKVVGSKMSITIDFKVAVDPKRIEKCRVMSVKARYAERIPPGGKVEGVWYP